MFGFDSLHRWFVASSSSLSSEKAADDELLFSNKRIVGVSLVFTGAIWLCASVVSFWASYGRIMTCVSCPANFSSSIFSTNYLDYWIPIVIGAIILEIGAILLGLSIFEKRASQISSTERTTMEINRSGRTRRFIVPRWL